MEAESDGLKVNCFRRVKEALEATSCTPFFITRNSNGREIAIVGITVEVKGTYAHWYLTISFLYVTIVR